MLKMARFTLLALALSCFNQLCFNQAFAAAETQPAATPSEHKAASDQAVKKEPVKKEPGVMDKTKSGWHKFTKSVKQGNKKPPCTQAAKSMGQCK